MSKFANSSALPLIFHYDLREYGALSFDMFLYSFEKMIIERLVKYNNDNKILLSTQDILNIALKF